jgi:hypothetical protein
MRAVDRVVALALLALLWSLPAMAAQPTLAQTLDRLERSIHGAAGLLPSLREQVISAELEEADAATAAGIADGGYISSLRALRAATIRLERRLEELRRQLPELNDPTADEILLKMRLALAELELAFEAVLISPDIAGRQAALARIDEALLSLDGATAAIWTLDGVGASGDRLVPAARGDGVSDRPPRPPPR